MRPRPAVDKAAWWMLLTVGFLWFMRIPEALSGTVILGALGIDSDQYLSAAGDIIRTPMPVIGGRGDFESGTVVRPPGYPALLAASFTVGGWLHLPITSCIVILHAVFFGLTLLVVHRTWRASLGNVYPLAITFAAALPMRDYAWMVLTEWLVFTLLIMFVCACVKARDSLAGFPSTIPILLVSALTLLRPDYVVLAPIGWWYSLGTRRSLSSALYVLLFGLAPLFVLTGINAVRFGHPSLAPLESGLFVLASTFSEPSEIVAALHHVGVGIDSVSTDYAWPPAWRATLALEPSHLLSVGLGNWEHAIRLVKEQGELRWPVIDRTLAQSACFLVMLHPIKYVISVGMGLMTLIWVSPMSALLIRARKLREPRGSQHRMLLVALGTHATHVFAIACLNIMYYRYYLPTFAVVLQASLLLLPAVFARPSREAYPPA